MAAVRQLRECLGMTQAQLAAELGRGMSTIQRWEQVAPPRGRALADLANLARSRGKDKLPGLFETTLSEEMGADNPEDKIIARACETAIHHRLLVPAAWKKAVRCLEEVIKELIEKKKSNNTSVASTLEELEWALIEIRCSVGGEGLSMDDAREIVATGLVTEEQATEYSGHLALREKAAKGTQYERSLRAPRPPRRDKDRKSN
jgi:transcriptional regulator with XRE-family HTH domain